MNFFEAVKSAFSKYGTIAGRSLRSEYWYFQLFIFIGALVSAVPDIQIVGMEQALLWGPVYVIFVLAVLVPNITVTVRRLHDVDRSGWWWFIPLTIIGLIPFLYWMCKKGDEGENRFGPEPLASDKKQ
jgi:uncharacterized membrane protein YhaH (DUF805 family)